MAALVNPPQAAEPVDEIDLSCEGFWAAPRESRDAAFARLRHDAPVHFFAESSDFSGLPPGPGYWALTRYEDVLHASRHPEVFSSGRGIRIYDAPPALERFRGSMIHMDDSRHARLRGLIQRGFTPRMVRQTEQWVRQVATSIVDEVIERHPEGECDAVEGIAGPLPLRVICRMMGIPAEDEPLVVRLTNAFVGAGDPEYCDGDDPAAAMARAGDEILEYAERLGAERRQRPRDDITTELMRADVDGERLSTREFGCFILLLVVAGNETTRNAIGHGIRALTDHPAQRRIWWEDFDATTPTAVEEILRWATPVRHLRRTAMTDTEVRGVRIRAGEKVVLWLDSANRDEDRFADPDVFDVRRAPNPHVALGGGGPHFCLGASLARQEIAVMFREIRSRLPGLHAAGEPAMLRSDFIHGIKRMPCAWT